MANEFRYGIDQNGVRHPVCDDTRVDWASYAVLGAQNMLPNNAITTTVGGVTYTKDDDGSMIPTGDTGNNWATINIVENYTLKAGTYTLSGVPNKAGAYIAMEVGGSTVYQITNGATKTFTLNEDTTFNRVRISTSENVTYTSGDVFKPMINPGSVALPYAPFAMTNKELTEKATVQTITHAEAVTGDNVSVTFTEDIIGNVEQIRGSVISSEDKAAGSQCVIALGSVIAHKPIGKVVGCISSSVSASDRKPINNITIDGNGSIQINGQMVANRSYDFSFIYVFA